MTPPARSLEVRVAGSTSNLGTGFDCLGLALDLWLSVRLTAAEDGGPRVVARGPAAERWPETGDRLPAAFDAAARAFGIAPAPRRFEVASEIPIARGLGSSGAATAAGLLLAAALADEPPSPAHLLSLGVGLEGHPDNVTASLLGGCTLGLPASEGPEGPAEAAAISVELSPALGYAVAWPDAAVETERARAVLPAAVPLADAVENARRLPFLLEGLRRGDPELLRLGAADRLHERHRLPLVPGAGPALAAAREAGAHAALLSGSGSALFAIATPEGAPAVAAAMVEALRRETGTGEGRAARAALGAPVVREVP